MYCWHLEAEITLKLTTIDGRVVTSMVEARSYGDKSGRGQKKTLKADDRSDYLDLVKKLPFMNNIEYTVCTVYCTVTIESIFSG